MDSEENENKIVKVVNDTVGISESPIVTAELFFGLTEPIQFYDTFKDSEEIKFTPSDDDPQKVSGLLVKIIDSNPQKIEDAYKKIRNILNYISVKLGRQVDHLRPEEFIVKDGKITRSKSFTFDSVLVKKFNLDLNDSKIQELITNKDPILNQQVADYVSGIKAHDDKNYRDAIRNFWLVLENENVSLDKDYKSLRHGLSHTEIYPKVKEQIEIDFGLKLQLKVDSTKEQKGYFIDTNDATNREILKQEANYLRELANKIIQGKIP